MILTASLPREAVKEAATRRPMGLPEEVARWPPNWRIVSSSNKAPPRKRVRDEHDAWGQPTGPGGLMRKEGEGAVIAQGGGSNTLVKTVRGANYTEPLPIWSQHNP